MSFWWRIVDSNHSRRSPTDLQSAPFSHLGNPPYEIVSWERSSSKMELVDGLEPPTC